MFPLGRRGHLIFWISASANFCPIWTIHTPLESSWKSRLRMPHFQTSGKDFSSRKSSLKFKFSSFYSPFNLTIHCCAPKIGKTYGCTGKLEKNFLLTLVQSAKYYHITRRKEENGYKCTNNPISEYRNFGISLSFLFGKGKSAKRNIGISELWNLILWN